MAQLVYCNLHVNKSTLCAPYLHDNVLNILAKLMLSATDMSVVLHVTHFRMFQCEVCHFSFTNLPHICHSLEKDPAIS